MSQDRTSTTTPITLKVEIAEPMGAESLVYLKTGAGSIIARIQGDHIFHLGEDVAGLLRNGKGYLLRSQDRKRAEVSFKC